MSRIPITAWHDGCDLVWYPAAWLHPIKHGGRDVILSGDGYQVTGRIGLDPASRKTCWIERLPASGVYVRLCLWRWPDANALPAFREPVAFALLDGDDASRWGTLPDPILRTKAMASGPPAPAAHEDFSEAEGWPYPGVTLGCKTPPQSLEETEARVLRALRTEDAQPRVGVSLQSHSADIPREFYHLMRRRQIAEELSRQRERGQIVDSDLKTVRIAWMPSRRDEGDWDYALQWMRALGHDAREVVKMRGANPPFSWRQIGRRLGDMPKTSVERLYRRAIADMMRAAQKAAQTKKDKAA